MNKYVFLYLILIVALISGCSSGKSSENDGLACIDVKKNYPEKEIILTDIADINYVHLSTENDDFLYKALGKYITDNTIVIFDLSSAGILFFSKDGTPKSRFSRYGQGPEEYTNNRMETILYDEVADDVFVPVRNGINVYSSTGIFKRKLTLPQGISGIQLVYFDDQTLLLYNNDRQFERFREISRKRNSGDNSTDKIIHYNDSSFFLISKTDGKVLDYVELPNNTTDLVTRGNGMIAIENNTRMVKCAEGVLLCHPETDTIFLYRKDKSLTPVICKTPLVRNSDSKIILSNYMETDRYLYIEVEKIIDFKKQIYMQDKKTGEIFRPKFILPDYTGKEFSTFPKYFEKEAYFELGLTGLKQAYKENRLSGKLKELVATLNEDEDNDVFMLIQFK